MCGIAGIYAITPEGADKFPRVHNAVSLMARRGPDCQHVYTEGRISLGHARLSVIDLSDKAAQPMHDVTGRYTIVYNGEVYNYRQLREKLVAKGYKFATNTDTEVILYQYINDGPKCLDKLVGFFAFAIYDKVDDVLFIARDRMGQKPLLYYLGHDSIVFASEMKALMALGVPRKLDMTSLFAYLQFNYIPSPNSIFENVSKLNPGHYLIVRNGQAKEVRYYSIPYNYSNLEVMDYEHAQQLLRELIEQSVAERLISDVPLGAFLSGGIDSSVIVAEASKHVDNLNTFSIGYADEPFFDETRYAELVAAKFHTNHHVFKLTNNDLYESLHGCIRVQRQLTPEGVNAKWLWDHLSRKPYTKVIIWDDLDRELCYPSDELTLYYNPNGGTNYHSQPTCTMVKDKYEPMTAFTYGELDKKPYNKLTACPACAPMPRKEKIDELNAKSRKSE